MNWFTQRQLGKSLAASTTFRRKPFRYEPRFAHGGLGSTADQIDVIVYDSDDLPFALMELKPDVDYESEMDAAIKYQLFVTAPLTGAPRFLGAYANGVAADGALEASIKAFCIACTRYRICEAWS